MNLDGRGNGSNRQTELSCGFEIRSGLNGFEETKGCKEIAELKGSGLGNQLPTIQIEHK